MALNKVTLGFTPICCSPSFQKNSPSRKFLCMLFLPAGQFYESVLEQPLLCLPAPSLFGHALPLHSELGEPLAGLSAQRKRAVLIPAGPACLVCSHFLNPQLESTQHLLRHWLPTSLLISKTQRPPVLLICHLAVTLDPS